MKTHLKGIRRRLTNGEIEEVTVCGLNTDKRISIWWEDGWEYLMKLVACKNCDRAIGYKR